MEENGTSLKRKSAPLAGIHPRRMDSKYRVVPPSDWRRDEWEDGLWVGINPVEKCVMVLSESDFSARLTTIEESDKINEKDRRMVSRRFFESFKSSKIDNQGRLALPKECVEKAGLKKEIELVGRGARFEIWDPEKSAIERERTEARYLAVCDEIGIL